MFECYTLFTKAKPMILAGNTKEVKEMAKSAYSIILDDDIVAAIDKMAYSLGTNRSGLINRILAEKVSYITPEQRVQHIIQLVLDNISDNMTFQPLPAGTNLLLKSAVKYKYNPTVRYSVTLSPQNHILGELKVSLRTQNTALLTELDNFLKNWVSWEKAYLPDKLPVSVHYVIEAGRFVRQLALPDTIKNDDIAAQAIWDYINVFDSVLKQYFHNGGDIDEKPYLTLIAKCKYLI